MSNSLSENKIKILLLLITILGQASVALYLPSLPDIALNLNVSPAVVNQTITAFIIGFGISPIFYGPLSDRYGRKPIILFSLCLACLGYAINVMASTIHLFIIARILQGLGCGGLLIGGRAIIRDVFSGRALASASSYLSMGFALGFGVSPVIGGYLGTHFGWKINFIFLLVFALCLIIVVLTLLPETLVRNEPYVPIKNFFINTLIEYKTIATHIEFLKFLAGGFFAYGVVVAYNVMTPFLMQHTFHVSALNYGYLALLIGTAYYLSAAYNRKLVLKWGVGPIFKVGSLLIVFSALGIWASDLWFEQNLLILIVCLAFAVFGQALIFSNTISCALQRFPAKSAGKASAIFSSLQMILVSFLAAVIALLPYNSVMSIAIVLLVLGMGCALLLFRINDE